MAALLSEQAESFLVLASELGADLSVPMVTGAALAPIHVAAQKGLFDVVKLIHEKGFCDGDGLRDLATTNGQTALHFAVERQHLPMVQYLVKEVKCNVNAPTRAGVTPLFTALVNTDEAIAESLAGELVKLGASLSGAVTNQGFTPLIAASARGDLPVAKLVVKLGATLGATLDGGVDLNATTRAGKTAVYCAAENGHDKTVNWLADQRADLDVQTETGSTAAMVAADNGHIKCLHILVRYRADLSLADKHGNTATSLAVRNGHVLKQGVRATTGELLPFIPPVADMLGAKDREQDIDLQAPGDPHSKVFGWTPGTRLVTFGTGDICTNHEPIPASKRRHVKLSVTDAELQSAPPAEKVSKPWE
jgi:ankyrin repeat protein